MALRLILRIIWDKACKRLALCLEQSSQCPRTSMTTEALRNHLKKKKRKKETISSLSAIKVKGTSEIRCVVQDKFKKHSQNEEERCEQKYCEI